MQMKVFCVTNLLSNLSDGLFLYPTEKAAAVELAALEVNTRHVPLDEVVLTQVGTFDTQTRELNSCPPVSVDWDTRRLRESYMNLENPSKIAQDMSQIN